MARNLTTIPNIVPADADYPNGRILNAVPPDAGTPVIEELYGDIVQFFHKLMRTAGISHNGLPENETQGFQFIQALAYYVRTLAASVSEKGVVELATGAETQAKLSALLAVTPAGLGSLVASQTLAGLAELATESEARAFDSTRILTSSILRLALRTETDYINIPGGFGTIYNVPVGVGCVMIANGSSNITINLPTASSSNEGDEIEFWFQGNSSGSSINGNGGSLVLTSVSNNYFKAKCDGDGLKWYITSSQQIANAEGLACPFIYINSHFIDEILKNHIGFENYKEEIVDITKSIITGDNIIRLSEEKDEITYIDYLTLIIDGKEIPLFEERIILDKGDYYDFPVKINKGFSKIELKAKGYYINK